LSKVIEPIWAIPTSWQWTTMGAVTEIIGGGTPSTVDPLNFIGDIPWITPADMSRHVGKFIEKGERSLSVAGLNGSGARWLKRGAVLFSSRAPIGYVCIAANPVTTNQGFKSFVPLGNLSSEYVYHWLTSAKPLAEKLASGTTFLEISGAKAALIPIPIAPSSEQTRIVAKLEELLSELDAVVAELKTAQKKLTQYRQSLLKAAVEGALTAEWRKSNPPTETGAQLLERILVERRARWEAKQLAKFKEQDKAPPKDWQSKYPVPVKPDLTGLPELPEGWVWTSIGQCFQVGVRATPSRKELDYWNGSIPWVSSGEIRFNRIEQTKETITTAGLKNSSTQLNPIGSVLLGMIGEGKTRGQVSILGIQAANNQNCAAIWVTETEIAPEYVYYWLWSQYENTRKGSSGNNQPALNKSIVERIAFPLPPIKEITTVVNILADAFDQIEAQEQFVTQTLKKAEAQRKNILKSAFSGKLVKQDPNDESASQLLARIAVNRGNLNIEGRGRKVSKPVETVT
jgi:type I restriction enzyme, S subunit